MKPEGNLSGLRRRPHRPPCQRKPCIALGKALLHVISRRTRLGGDKLSRLTICNSLPTHRCEAKARRRYSAISLLGFGHSADTLKVTLSRLTIFPIKLLILLVRTEGLEPSRAYAQGILSFILARGPSLCAGKQNPISAY